MAEEYNIGCLVANPPVHNTVPYIAKHAGHWHLPVSEEIASRLTCISLHPSMTPEQNEFICAAMIEAVERLR
jgi:dTDP-4-amino-4,6-dideoxygalactose transaminase